MLLAKWTLFRSQDGGLTIWELGPAGKEPLSLSPPPPSSSAVASPKHTPTSPAAIYRAAPLQEPEPELPSVVWDDIDLPPEETGLEITPPRQAILQTAIPQELGVAILPAPRPTPNIPPKTRAPTHPASPRLPILPTHPALPVLPPPTPVPSSPTHPTFKPELKPPSEMPPDRFLPSLEMLQSNFRGHKKKPKDERYVPRIYPPPPPRR